MWRKELPVAIIDFDNVAAGERLDDLGYAVWKHLNLGLIDLAPEDQWSRLRVMTESYGAAPDDGLLRAIERAQERMRLLIEASPPGPERDEALAQHSREQAWLSRNGRRLVG